MASAEIPREELAQSIKELIKGADLSKLTSKIIRQKLGDKYGLDFIDRKKEIDQLLMKALDEAENENGKDESESEKSDSGSDSEFEEPEDMGPPVKKVKLNKTTKKPARKSSDDSPMDDEELAKQLQEEENGTSRRTRTFKNPKPVKQKKPKKEKTEGSSRKGKGLYGQEMELSPILAEVMGTDKMVRSDIVKRMWEIIKERNLADPKNRQFMKCDEQMQKLFGRKRVKTFGMMKYLKDHIFKPGELAELTTS